MAFSSFANVVGLSLFHADFYFGAECQFRKALINICIMFCLFRAGRRWTEYLALETDSMDSNPSHG